MAYINPPIPLAWMKFTDTLLVAASLSTVTHQNDRKIQTVINETIMRQKVVHAVS